MQHGPLLGDVDLLSAEHRVDPRAQIRLLGQLKEELKGLIGDPVLRIIEEDSYGLGRQALATFRVIREQLAEMQVLDLRVVCLERFPCRKLDHSRCRGHIMCSLLLVDYELAAVRAARGRSPSCHIRNPPRKALALLPARQPLGSSLRTLTLPPPRTTSSGARALIK